MAECHPIAFRWVMKAKANGAKVIHIDPREHKMGLSIKALRRSEERAEMEAYLKREREEARFSFEDILREELRLDKDEGDNRGGKRRG